MFQFPAFPIAQGNCDEEFPFGNPEFFASVRLPRAYRSLARPSSASEPSHPPGGITAMSSARLSDEHVRYTPGSHVHAVSSARPLGAVGGACIDPSHPRLSGMVHRSAAPIRELHPERIVSTGETCAVANTVDLLASGRSAIGPRKWAGASPQSRSVGGDPGADSPTPTLLRLKPPCGAQTRPP